MSSDTHCRALPFNLRQVPLSYSTVDGWMGGGVEGWRGGGVEGWKGGRVEGWKGGRVEGWKG